MKLPWDKLEFKKVDPDTKKGTKPSIFLMDEIGQMNSPFPHDIGWKTVPLITNPQLEYEVKSYPDGSKYVVVKKIRQNLTFRLNSYEDLWILGQIHDVVKSAGWTVTVTIPFLIDSQADRRFDIDQPHGLKLVCNFLNGLSKFSYKIFHPHNPEVVEALLDRVEIVDNSEFIHETLSNIQSEIYDNNSDDMENGLMLMSSDAGGFKPLMKLADKLDWKGETFSASKSRKYEEEKSRLVQQVDRQDFEGKDILIVDDICVYGGTFKGLAKMLKERNCGKLYLAVSHMTIQDLGEDPVTDYFDRVFTTNSKFDSYEKPLKFHGDSYEPENLTIIKLFQ